MKTSTYKTYRTAGLFLIALLLPIILTGCARGVKVLSCNVTVPADKTIIVSEGGSGLIVRAPQINPCDNVYVYNSTSSTLKILISIFGNDGVKIASTNVTLESGKTSGPHKQIIDPAAQQVLVTLNSIFGTAKFSPLSTPNIK